MKFYLLILIALVAICALACRRRDPVVDAHSLVPATASRYKPGQVWSLRTPSEQSGAVLRVLRVEANPKLGTIVHVALSGLNLPNGPSNINIQHLPFSEQGVDRSVLRLLRENEALPDFHEGYDHWRQAFDAGRRGIWVDVSEGIEAFRTAWREANPKGGTAEGSANPAKVPSSDPGNR